MKNVVTCLILLCAVSTGVPILPADAAPSLPDKLLIPSGPDAECLKLDGNLEKLSWNAEGDLVWEAPAGDRVLFSFPLPRGAKFSDYGLGKFDLNIEGGSADAMVSAAVGGADLVSVAGVINGLTQAIVARKKYKSAL